MHIPTPPTAADFGDEIYLDVRTAVRNFLGKGQAAAYEMFAGNSNLAYTEDLAWMGPNAFDYYIEPAVRYVESHHSQDDMEFVSFLLTSILTQANQQDLSRRSASTVVRLLDHIDSNPTKFAAAEDLNINWEIAPRISELRGLIDRK